MLVRVGRWEHPTYLILDLDPPDAGAFGLAVRAAGLIREALAGAGLAGAVKTSGAKGVHVFVPVDEHAGPEAVDAAPRARHHRAARVEPGSAPTALLHDA